MKNLIKAAGKSTVEVQLIVYVIKEGDYYVSYCPALNLSSFGKNEKDAIKGFDEAFKIFLEDTNERKTLEKVLLDLGWKLQKLPIAKYTPPGARSIRTTFTSHYPTATTKKEIKETVEIPV